jgi:hypothetical protein
MSLVACSSQICVGPIILVRMTQRWVAKCTTWKAHLSLPVTGQQHLPYPTRDHTVVSMCPLYVAVQTNDTKLSEHLCLAGILNTSCITTIFHSKFSTDHMETIYMPEIFGSWQWILWLYPIPWNMMIHNFVGTDQHFGENCCLHLRAEKQFCTLEMEAAGPPKCRYLSTQLHIASHNTVIFIIYFTPQFQNPWMVQYLCLIILNSSAATESFLTLPVCNKASPIWGTKLQQFSALHCKSKY